MAGPCDNVVVRQMIKVLDAMLYCTKLFSNAMLVEPIS
jgi:hypothetical protein